MSLLWAMLEVAALVAGEAVVAVSIVVGIIAILLIASTPVIVGEKVSERRGKMAGAVAGILCGWVLITCVGTILITIAGSLGGGG